MSSTEMSELAARIPAVTDAQLHVLAVLARSLGRLDAADQVRTLGIRHVFEANRVIEPATFQALLARSDTASAYWAAELAHQVLWWLSARDLIEADLTDAHAALVTVLDASWCDQPDRVQIFLGALDQGVSAAAALAAA